MIEKFLDEVYWEGLEEELREIAKKHPLVYLPFQERDSYYMTTDVFTKLIKELARNEFVYNFLYNRENYYPIRESYKGQFLFQFETIGIVEEILDNLPLIKEKILNIIAATKSAKDCEAGRFYHDPTYIERLSKEKNLEVLWKELHCPL